MDNELLSQFESLCKKFGTNMNSAFVKLVSNEESYIEKVRQQGRDAFERLRKQAEDLPEMSLDEINAEIMECRTGRFLFRNG